VISKDFFLSHCADDFIEHARQLIFEMFCRIHQKISIKMLAEKLNMDEDHAERWLVNLIRNAQMDAKIDASKVRHINKLKKFLFFKENVYFLCIKKIYFTQGHVVMGAKASSLHEQVMENTKRLSLRAQQMSITLEKVQKEKMVSFSIIILKYFKNLYYFQGTSAYMPHS
jgi:translation initiation factor 3 subunit E